MSASLVAALRRVVGGRMRDSGIYVWRDDSTWNSIASDLLKALSSTHVLVDRATYDELVQDAARMKRVRQHVDEYNALTKKNKKITPQNAYGAWASENMKGEK